MADDRSRADLYRTLGERLLRENPGTTTEPGETVEMTIPMRDGVELAATVVFPAGDGPWPVVLMRNPYMSMRNVDLATYSLLNRYGYVFVYESCRGTCGSGGEWEPFANEREDGLDTLNWLTAQPWMDGNIGMCGMSYLSYVQWIVADEMPKEVRTLIFNMFGVERYRQVYMNGMFRHDIYTWWCLENSGYPIGNPEEAYKKALTVRPRNRADIEAIGHRIPVYQEYLEKVSGEDEYWQTGQWAELRRIPGRLDIPVLMIEGWFDHHLDGAVSAWNLLSDRSRQKSRFLIGPWDHLSMSPGNLKHPGSDVLGTRCFSTMLEWFDHCLKGKPYPHPVGTVETYVIGRGEWVVQKDFPPENVSLQAWYPDAGRQSGTGYMLVPEPSGAESTISYVYDPENPVPTRGGSALLSFSGRKDPEMVPRGSQIQNPPGSREDIITFLSDPLEGDLEICGNVMVRLSVSSDAEDTAFTAVVMEMTEEGISNNICDGITSLSYRNGAGTPQPYEPGSRVDVDIEMWPTDWMLKKGSRLRVDISSSNFPAYEAHANYKGPWAEQEKTKHAHQAILTGGDTVSAILLPVRDSL